MVDSIISSHHHFYVFFVSSPKLRSLKGLAELFDFPSSFEIKSFNKKKELSYCHLQLGLPKAYGNELLFEANKKKLKNGDTIFWHDFYLGRFTISNNEYYYICYPYNKLGKLLENCLHEKNVFTNFYKPNVEEVLTYMKKRKNNRNTEPEKEGLYVEITKFTAQVEEEGNANKINLIGNNPLNSRAFDVLKTDLGISIETVSLKLNCNLDQVGNVDLSFDRLGNYRFWLRRDSQEITLPVIPSAFRFLMQITPLKTSSFVSKNTLLEND